MCHCHNINYIPYIRGPQPQGTPIWNWALWVVGQCTCACSLICMSGGPVHVHICRAQLELCMHACTHQPATHTNWSVHVCAYQLAISATCFPSLPAKSSCQGSRKLPYIFVCCAICSFLPFTLFLVSMLLNQQLSQKGLPAWIKNGPLLWIYYLFVCCLSRPGITLDQWSNLFWTKYPKRTTEFPHLVPRICFLPFELGIVLDILAFKGDWITTCPWLWCFGTP